MGRPTYEIELSESERKSLVKQIQNEPERRLADRLRVILYKANVSQDYHWMLLPSSGMKYVHAWARDKAGNVSAYPYQQLINYTPNLDTVAQGEARVYRYQLHANQPLIIVIVGTPPLPNLMAGHAVLPRISNDLLHPQLAFTLICCCNWPNGQSRRQKDCLLSTTKTSTMDMVNSIKSSYTGHHDTCLLNPRPTGSDSSIESSAWVSLFNDDSRR